MNCMCVDSLWAVGVCSLLLSDLQCVSFLFKIKIRFLLTSDLRIHFKQFTELLIVSKTLQDLF